jgi:Fic family protein
VLAGDNPGTVADADHAQWYRELFGPSVAVGLLAPAVLAGYRSGPVYIRRSMHSPPNRDAVRELMPTLFELLAEEPSAAVRVVLGHFQFVYVHPVLDGNGRIGRLLIAALFEHWGLLREPLLYLSGYLKQHQAEYYRRLSTIRTEGDWESWVSFFLEGVAAAAADAENSIIEVASLVAVDRRQLLQSPRVGPASYRLFEMLPMMPRFTVERVRQQLNTSFPTANAAVQILEVLGIVTEMTGQKKNRSYSYQAYVELLSR